MILRHCFCEQKHLNIKCTVGLYIIGLIPSSCVDQVGNVATFFLGRPLLATMVSHKTLLAFCNSPYGEPHVAFRGWLAASRQSMLFHGPCPQVYARCLQVPLPLIYLYSGGSKKGWSIWENLECGSTVVAELMTFRLAKAYSRCVWKGKVHISLSMRLILLQFLARLVHEMGMFQSFLNSVHPLQVKSKVTWVYCTYCSQDGRPSVSRSVVLQQC